MNGQRPLLTMRRAGNAPRAVWITDGDDIRARDWHLERNCVDGEFHACVQIDHADIPEALDLRFAIGMECHLTCERGDERAKRLHQAVVEAGARIVATSSDSLFLTHGVPSHG